MGSALSSDVDVAYTLTGDIVAGATSGTARIVAGQTSVDVTVPTSGNTLYSDHHTVTLTLTAPGDGAYAFVTNKQSVAVEVRDDDFPDARNAVADMEVDDTSVAEGGTVTVTVRIELDSLTDFPHASSPPVRLYAADRPPNTPGDKATAGDDYQALDVQVSIPPENFEIGNSDFYGRTIVGTATLKILILFDPEAEVAEKFDVHLSDSRLAYAFVVTALQTITIAANAAASTEAALGSLSASPAALTPDFAPTTYSYAGSVATTVTQVTLAAAPSDPGAHLVEYLDDNNDAIVDADGNEGNGLQAALAVDDNVFTVRVTAEDRATTQDYTVTITRRLSDVATLSALTIRDSAATGHVHPVVLHQLQHLHPHRTGRRRRGAADDHADADRPRRLGQLPPRRYRAVRRRHRNGGHVRSRPRRRRQRDRGKGHRGRRHNHQEPYPDRHPGQRQTRGQRPCAHGHARREAPPWRSRSGCHEQPKRTSPSASAQHRPAP